MTPLIQQLLHAGPGEWVRHAKCAKHPNPDAWFPPKGQPSEETRYAKAICKGCPVIADCLAYALTSPVMEHGIWGGMIESDRKSLRRGVGLSTRPANPIYPLCGTEAGAKVHERRGEKRCPACTRAVNVAKTNRASA